ncbi:serine hydrolase-like protein 2 [Anticarsia gemmatalis]|uniref:serine hydrolase-like protein 2 n=1 Tax=Anticarsia gemmatalis TaxID=129554 RepID=UPI003F77371F
MPLKETKEWYIDAQWGKIAMVSWGNPSSPPVLMCHGYMDTAATFTLLVEHLSPEYYYVAFDLPGHGKSDPFPPGPHVSQIHMVEVIRTIVDHMGWKTFVYMAHSMAVVIGCIYHTVYPGRMSMMISLDPGLPLHPYYAANYHHDLWYKRYPIYYEHFYNQSASDNPKLYEYDKIVSTLARNRFLSKEQAKIVLSRSLVEVDNGIYRLTWEPRVKLISPLALSLDNLTYLSLNNLPPTLVTHSSIVEGSEEEKLFAENILKGYNRLRNCSIVNIDGHHDVHITSPEKMAGHINEFLKRERVKSKL